MILGIGIDMTEIERIEKACERQAFFLRIYTPAEQELYGGNIPSLAARFAVKEAVVKAFGTGFRGIQPSEIETVSDELGKPVVKLYGEARKRFGEMGCKQIHVSITHTKTTAAAMVVLEGERACADC
ncbi:MAG: holo-ACP synthase [Lachnospiraceae bacterium]|nr:holo-ACP synthase [Lachnospiraceae bacterium]